jgi:hypothetical protein
VWHVPGDPDLPGSHEKVEFEHPPVGGDRPRRRRVQALIADEFDRGRVGQPRPQQVGLPVVIADDDGLAGGHTFFDEWHDQGSELGVGAVEAGFVEVAHVAAGRARPHHTTPISVEKAPTVPSGPRSGGPPAPNRCGHDCGVIG